MAPAIPRIMRGSTAESQRGPSTAATKGSAVALRMTASGQATKATRLSTLR